MKTNEEKLMNGKARERSTAARVIPERFGSSVTLIMADSLIDSIYQGNKVVSNAAQLA